MTTRLPEIVSRLGLLREVEFTALVDMERCLSISTNRAVLFDRLKAEVIRSRPGSLMGEIHGTFYVGLKIHDGPREEIEVAWTAL